MPLVPPRAGPDDLRTLLALAEQGLAHQDRADAVLAACADAEDPRSAVAREGGRVAGEYHRLWAWSLDVAPQAGPDSLERRLGQVLLQHCHLVHGAVRMAFPKLRTARTEEQRRSVDGLGTTAAALRAVHDEIVLWIELTGDRPGFDDPH
jgi:hypothetical protein